MTSQSDTSCAGPPYILTAFYPGRVNLQDVAASHDLESAQADERDRLGHTTEELH